jgi:hypothetical protein
MKKLFLFTLFHLTTVFCIAQGAVQADSLLQELGRAREDTNKVLLLLQTG